MIDFAFKYRLHVALLACTMCLSLFSHNLNTETFLVSLSFGLLFLFVYLLNKTTDLKEDALNPESMPITPGDKKKVARIAFFCAALPIPYLFWINPKILAFYVLVPGLAGIVYSYPLRILGFKRRIKDLAFVKNIFSAVIWASIPATLPILYYNQNFTLSTFYAFVSVALVVFTIEVIWDIRDIKGDLAAGIKTFPNQFGVVAAKTICGLPFLVLMLTKISSLALNPQVLVKYLLTLTVVVLIRPNSHPYFFQSIILIWLIPNLINLTKLIG